ncbi:MULTISPECIES: acyltransferase [unclassified Luteibacter]|uniref:acyltransferase n=1 Tax=unclassified Luteibacter TaxID=2620188 RepID=UPI0008B23E4C|nr:MULTISPECIES: acyltransferase [unclassified Luteibacter]MDR6937624.1 1-acyl-sn-glycerol-3-phosphate acyltransferase [Luteibacter sp. 3190]SEO37778.1 1-acyl-sn-glycerol-3-phosphate acyltransferases [Luteibacter sp. UNC138MFCol5.1]SEW28835.1 1-acyl-sn-glycerol-3-phosphate acyltransferases [Luteibacter sp. 329MFSha]
MFASLPTFLRVPLACLLLIVSTVLHVLPLFALTLLRLLVPVQAVRRSIGAMLVGIAESWLGFNGWLFGAFTRTRWIVEGDEGLSYRENYLVVCNHQSWVDIPALQRVFNRRIPFMRFFLKSELIWVPLLGPAWWALDFPFMKRHSRQQLEARPELRGKDRDATRRACEKFRHLPVSVMNFTEGTRFTRAKHDAQQSPYAHLLKPKAGGVAFVIDAMGDAIRQILDVTIVYPDGPATMMDMIAGRIREVRMHIRRLPIPAAMRGDYENDAAFRERFQLWINALWAEKDARIGAMLGA